MTYSVIIWGQWVLKTQRRGILQHCIENSPDIYIKEHMLVEKYLQNAESDSNKHVILT